MSILTRRTFISSFAAAGFVAILPRRTRAGMNLDIRESGKSIGITVDALCYEPNLTSEMIEHAIQANLNAVVFDIAAWPREYDNAVRELSRWAARFAEPDTNVLAVRRASDFERAKKVNKLGIVLACQDATILGSSLGPFAESLRLFHTLGLRVLQLTHNSRTHWADSFMEKRDGGLSLAGERLVVEMNQLGVIIDLSHCSRQTLLDTVKASTKPCAVTHAGCRALAPTARNKSDEEIKALGQAGGFFGVYNMTTWLTSGPTASLNTVLDHIDHVVQLIGPLHVGFGSDGALDRLDMQAEVERMGNVQKNNSGGPSAEWPVRHVRVPELNAPGRLKALADGLARRGYSDAHIDGIVGGNFVRLLERVCE